MYVCSWVCVNQSINQSNFLFLLLQVVQDMEKFLVVLSANIEVIQQMYLNMDLDFQDKVWYECMYITSLTNQVSSQ